MPLVPQPFRVVEIFAGDAKISKSMQYAEISTAQRAVKMGTKTWNRTRKAFDLLTSEGLACFGCTMVLFTSGKIQPKHDNPKVTAALCRLAVWTLMNVEYGNFLCWIALVCSSFNAVNVATSGRTPATPWGRTFLPYVAAP